jgi:PAS domain S-box-containing protein
VSDDPNAEPLDHDDDVFRLVAEASRDMIILGRPGANEWVSPSVEELLGLTPEEFLSMDTISLVHPDDRERIGAARPRIAAGLEASGRLRLRHTDGTWRCLEARVRPLPDPDGTYSGRSISSWRDVTREVDALERLRASEEQARLLVEHVSDGVALVREGVFQWVTPNLHEMLGWEPDEWRGRDLIELMGPGQEVVLADARERVRAGELPTVRLRLENAAGELHWVEVRTRPYVDDHGERAGTICVFRIVDAEVAAEAELEHRAC